LRREEFELQALFWTLVNTIETKVTLWLMPRNTTDRVVASLTAQKTAIAVVALLGILEQSPHRPTRENSQQCAEGTDCATPESCHMEIKGKNEYKKNP